MLAKRFIKNLWFSMLQGTWEFGSVGLKSVIPAERIAKEVQSSPVFWGLRFLQMYLGEQAKY